MRMETPPPQPPSLAPSENPPAPIAPGSAEEKAKAFIASFDGGDCFLVEPLPGATAIRFDSLEVPYNDSLTLEQALAERDQIAFDLGRLDPVLTGELWHRGAHRR